MELQTTKLAILGLFASVAFGQDATRTFRFGQTQTENDMNEIASVIRVISEISQVSVDPVQRVLSYSGALDQVGAADWLLKELVQPSGATSERRMAGDDDVVRLFHVAHAPTLSDLQEIAVMVRTAADIRRLTIYGAPRTLAVRGTASQIALAAWMIDSLAQASDPQATPQLRQDLAKREHRPADGGDDVVRLFYLARSQSAQELNEIAVDVRTIAAIRRVITHNAAKAVAVRGTPEQVALAEWMIDSLTQASDPLATAQFRQNLGKREYRPADGGGDVVRLFYLAHSQSPQELNKIAVEVRRNAEIPRLMIHTAAKAVAVRGTPEQIVLADRLIQERDK